LDDTRLPLTAHLAELRTRLFWMIGCFALASFASWEFRDPIFGYLLRPATAALGPEGAPLQAIAPTEIFFTYLESALLAGFVLALPVIFWQIWAFVAPGLYPAEKRRAAVRRGREHAVRGRRRVRAPARLPHRVSVLRQLPQ
jgi:sec-independent protein translocase protein TatC